MVLPADYNRLSAHERRIAREQYAHEQGNLCAHCGVSLSGPPRVDIRKLWVDLSLFPQNFLVHPVHLHHNHKTGMTIGAVHARCNAVLFQYKGE